METFLQAVQAIFNPVSDPATQQQANAWLNNFAGTAEAWDVSLAALDAQLPGNVLFFSANVLVNKAKTDWGRLPQERRAQYQAAVSTKLQQGLAAGADTLLLHRLSLALAAMAVRTGPEAAVELVRGALSLASQASGPQALRCGLTMLTETCSEAANLDTARTAALQQALTPCTGQVLGLLQSVLTSGATIPGVVSDVLRCLHAWSQDPTGRGQVPVTIAALHGEYPALYAALYAQLTNEDGEVVENVGLVLSTLLSIAPDELVGPKGAAWRAAAVATVAHLAGLRGALLKPGDGGAATARGVARCGTALSDSCAEFAGGALPPLTGTNPASAPLPSSSRPSQVAAAAAAAAAAPPDPQEAQAALQLAEIMITCLQRPERGVADAAIDYLINLNTIPVARRLPQLQKDVYASALPLLLKQAQYASDFTSWEDSEEDEGTFTRFRDHLLSELLESTYAMLGLQYLVSVQQAFQSAPSWQGAEASIFAVRAINMPLKLAMLGRDRADPAIDTRSAEQLAQAAQASAMLLSITTALCRPEQGSTAQRYLSSSPWVVKETCRLLGEYAVWFAKAGILAAAVAEAAPGATEINAALAAEAPLDGALQLTLMALAHPVPRHEAAQAFRNLCVRCSSKLATNQALPGLVNAALQAIAPSADITLAEHAANGAPPRRVLQHSAGGTPTPVTKHRELVIEGLGRLVGTLEVEAMGQAGAMLTQPLVTRAQAFAQAGTTGTPGALILLADDLSLLAAAIRFMDFPGNAPPGMPHPALQVLEAAWPVLSAVAQHEACRREPEVVAALCEVYQRSLMSAKVASKELLPALLTSVTAIMTTHPHPGCCDLLGTAVELFGEAKSSPQTAELQANALPSVVATVAAAVQGTPNGLTAHTELLRSVYNMADLYFVFARDTLLASPALQQLISLGCVVVGLREREPVAAALAFLMHVLGIADKLNGEGAAEQRSRLEACMTAQGAQLVQALTMAVADSCPRQLARPLSGLLYVLLQSNVWGQAVRAWLSAALQSQQFASVAGNTLDTETLGRVYTLLARAPPLPRGRFDALIGDLSAVIRGEAQSDVLMAYEM